MQLGMCMLAVLVAHATDLLIAAEGRDISSH